MQYVDQTHASNNRAIRSHAYVSTQRSTNELWSHEIQAPKPAEHCHQQAEDRDILLRCIATASCALLLLRWRGSVWSERVLLCGRCSSICRPTALGSHTNRSVNETVRNDGERAAQRDVVHAMALMNQR